MLGLHDDGFNYYDSLLMCERRSRQTDIQTDTRLKYEPCEA